MSIIRELGQELATVFAGRLGSFLDVLLPPLIFVTVNAFFGTDAAIWTASAFSVLLVVWRALRGGQFASALGGLLVVLLTAIIYRRSGSGSAFFVPGLAIGAGLVLASLISNLVSRPLAAWSSFLTRRWTLDWYWHPRVLPAYREVTWFWCAAFLVRLLVELRLFQQEDLGVLGGARIVLGWPYTLMILIVSYLYGSWRLRQLHGPSVDEFRAGDSKPWEGQRRGF